MSTQTPTTPQAAPRRGSPGHPGPPLGAPMITFVVTFFVSVVLGPIAGAGTVPSPFASTATVAGHFADHPGVTATSAWFMLLSSVGLLVFSAVAYSRLTFLAPNAPGPAIAGVGGVAASALLALSAAVTWTLSTSVVTDQPRLVHALHYLNFVCGGPAHTAALGMLVLGVAVTTIFLNRTPRVLSIIGVALALIDLLSTITLLTDAAAPLIPVGRFASMLWLLALSLLIPRDRAARRRRPSERPGQHDALRDEA